jgi:hypothetical protein
LRDLSRRVDARLRPDSGTGGTDQGTFESDLGVRIARLGDVNGDGIGDCVAAAEPNDLGQVRVDSGSDGTRLLTLVGSGVGDLLGHAIGGAGDLDGDGIDDLLCSGLYPRGEGHVDAYSVVTGKRIWRIDGKYAPPFSYGEGFGAYVEALGDINGDGDADLLVSVAEDDHDGRNVGRVDLVSGRTHRSLFRFYAGLKGLYRHGTVIRRGVDFNGDGGEDYLIGTYYGGSNKAKGGHVAIFSANDLWLQADPLKPTSSETVTVDLRGGEPSSLGLIALTAVDGVAQFETLLVTAFDSNGEIQLLADTDPSVSGHDFEILAYAENRSGRGPLMVSSPQTVEVQ